MLQILAKSSPLSPPHSGPFGKKGAGDRGQSDAYPRG